MTYAFEMFRNGERRAAIRGKIDVPDYYRKMLYAKREAERGERADKVA